MVNHSFYRIGSSEGLKHDSSGTKLLHPCVEIHQRNEHPKCTAQMHHSEAVGLGIITSPLALDASCPQSPLLDYYLYTGSSYWSRLTVIYDHILSNAQVTATYKDLFCFSIYNLLSGNNVTPKRPFEYVLANWRLLKVPSQEFFYFIYHIFTLILT